MRTRHSTTFRDLRFERQLALERGEQIRRLRASGQLRITKDFTPAQLAVLQARVAGYIASGICRVSWSREPPLATL